MIQGIGTDLIEIKRIAGIYNKYGERFLCRVFTPLERQKAATLSFEKRVAYYAKRFAAKEAVAKALHTGIGHALSWQDISILNTSAGEPVVQLAPEIRARFAPQGHKIVWHISLSDDGYALAFVVAEIVKEE